MKEFFENIVENNKKDTRWVIFYLISIVMMTISLPANIGLLLLSVIGFILFEGLFYNKYLNLDCYGLKRSEVIYNDRTLYDIMKYSQVNSSEYLRLVLKRMLLPLIVASLIFIGEAIYFNKIVYGICTVGGIIIVTLLMYAVVNAFLNYQLHHEHKLPSLPIKSVLYCLYIELAYVVALVSIFTSYCIGLAILEERVVGADRDSAYELLCNNRVLIGGYLFAALLLVAMILIRQPRKRIIFQYELILVVVTALFIGLDLFIVSRNNVVLYEDSFTYTHGAQVEKYSYSDIDEYLLEVDAEEDALLLTAVIDSKEYELSCGRKWNASSVSDAWKPTGIGDSDYAHAIQIMCYLNEVGVSGTIGDEVPEWLESRNPAYPKIMIILENCKS